MGRREKQTNVAWVWPLILIPLGENIGKGLEQNWEKRLEFQTKSFVTKQFIQIRAKTEVFSAHPCERFLLLGESSILGESRLQ